MRGLHGSAAGSPAPAARPSAPPPTRQGYLVLFLTPPPHPKKHARPSQQNPTKTLPAKKVPGTFNSRPTHRAPCVARHVTAHLFSNIQSQISNPPPSHAPPPAACIPTPTLAHSPPVHVVHQCPPRPTSTKSITPILPIIPISPAQTHFEIRHSNSLFEILLAPHPAPPVSGPCVASIHPHHRPPLLKYPISNFKSSPSHTPPTRSLHPHTDTRPLPTRPRRPPMSTPSNVHQIHNSHTSHNSHQPRPNPLRNSSFEFVIRNSPRPTSRTARLRPMCRQHPPSSPPTSSQISNLEFQILPQPHTPHPQPASPHRHSPTPHPSTSSTNVPPRPPVHDVHSSHHSHTSHNSHRRPH